MRWGRGLSFFLSLFLYFKLILLFFFLLLLFFLTLPRSRLNEVSALLVISPDDLEPWPVNVHTLWMSRRACGKALPHLAGDTVGSHQWLEHRYSARWLPYQAPCDKGSVLGLVGLVSVFLWLGEISSLIIKFYLSIVSHTIVWDPPMRYTLRVAGRLHN